MNNPKAYKMSFASVYPLYIAKVERKGRTKEEVDQVIDWLTGYKDETLKQVIESNIDFETFFGQAPNLNPNRNLIKGKICGVQIEEIEEDLMREIRYLDKLVDEVSKGRPMDKILRKSSI